MKIERLEELVLLESSGELGAFRSWLLRRELARNADLRAFRAALAGLRETAPRHTLAGVPDLPRDVRAAILAAAESHIGKPAPAGAAPLRWASACAAALLVAVGLRMTWQQPSATTTASPVRQAQIAWEDTWDEHLALLKSEVIDYANESAGDSALNEELEALAGQLLTAEGVQI